MSNDKPIKITLFHAEWCNHCVEFMPTWNKMRKDPHARKNIKFISYKDTDMVNLSKEKKTINGESIEGFPTIKIDMQGISYNYMGDRKSDDIYKFILDKLQKSSNRGKNESRTSEHTSRVSDFDGNEMGKQNINYINKVKFNTSIDVAKLEYEDKYNKLFNKLRST